MKKKCFICEISFDDSTLEQFLITVDGGIFFESLICQDCREAFAYASDDKSIMHNGFFIICFDPTA